MILYVDNSKIWKAAEPKINMQELVVFLYTKKEISEKHINGTIPLTIA